MELRAVGACEVHEIPGPDATRKSEAGRCTRPAVATRGGFHICEVHFENAPSGRSWKFQATGGVFYAWDPNMKS